MTSDKVTTKLWRSIGRNNRRSWTTFWLFLFLELTIHVSSALSARPIISLSFAHISLLFNVWVVWTSLLIQSSPTELSTVKYWSLWQRLQWPANRRGRLQDSSRLDQRLALFEFRRLAAHLYKVRVWYTAKKAGRRPHAHSSPSFPNRFRTTWPFRHTLRMTYADLDLMHAVISTLILFATWNFSPTLKCKLELLIWFDSLSRKFSKRKISKIGMLNQLSELSQRLRALSLLSFFPIFLMELWSQSLTISSHKIDSRLDIYTFRFHDQSYNVRTSMTFGLFPIIGEKIL